MVTKSIRKDRIIALRNLYLLTNMGCDAIICLQYLKENIKSSLDHVNQSAELRALDGRTLNRDSLPTNDHQIQSTAKIFEHFL